MAGADLVLDQQVRDWVVIPLTLCILLMMVLRQYATKVSRHARPKKLTEEAPQMLLLVVVRLSPGLVMQTPRR